MTASLTVLPGQSWSRYRWMDGCGKGPGPRLWPSKPQKRVAPQSPGHDLPSWRHKRIPWEGTEALLKAAGSR